MANFVGKVSSYFSDNSEPLPSRVRPSQSRGYRQSYRDSDNRRYDSYDYEDDGYGKSGGYGHSEYGSFGYGHKHKLQCCPLVVDPLTFTALLGAIAAATVFLNTLITMNIMAAGRRKRTKRSKTGFKNQSFLQDILQQGITGNEKFTLINLSF